MKYSSTCKKNITRRNFVIGGSIVSIGLQTPVQANLEKYPEREIQMIINYGAGGNTDVASRAIGNTIGNLLETPIVSINRGGAQGTLGVSSLAKQRPDGYTFGVVTFSTMAITPHLLPVDYNIDSFDYIAGVARYRYGIAVRADSVYRTLQDLINASKKSEGIFFGSPSGPNSLVMFELGLKTGGNFEQVNYKSGAEAINALLGGLVEVVVQNPSDIVQHINSGKIRLLASASPIRWKEFPNIATLKEQGYGIEIESWIGFALPRGTPASIRTKLENVAMAAIASLKLSSILENIGVDPIFLTGYEYKNKLIHGRESMKKLIQSTNFRSLN